MYSVGHEYEPSAEDLEERIRSYLVTALRTLSSLNLDISLYLLHHTQDVRRDPFGGNGLDEVYTMYEERANECRRLWMKIRAASEKRASITGAADSSPSKSRLNLETPLSLLEYRSALDEDEPAGAQGNNQVTPMDVDPVKVGRNLPRPQTPAVDSRPPKQKPKVRPCLLQIELLLMSFFAPERRHSYFAGCDHHPERSYLMSTRPDSKGCEVVN